MATRFSKMIGRVWLIVFFVAAGAGLLFYLWQYGPFSPGAREARRAENFIKEWEAKYKNDTYGGATPEETLQLFITALKNGDTDLAAKYFLIDKQENILRYLKDTKDNGNTTVLVEELSFPYTKRTLVGESKYIFDIYNSKDNTHIQFYVTKNTNGIWKIISI